MAKIQPSADNKCMVSIWIIIGLILATISVSVLGASFSVVGLSALFSGAMLAVCAMAISLEFAKFVLAAYVHQRWLFLNKVFRSYLVFAIVVLSIITSMGIFGFLSDAYQSASTAIDEETIKLEALKTEQTHNTAEIERLYKAIDEIPEKRISKKMKARADAEPAILELTKKNEAILAKLTQSNLRMLDVKKRVGPLIYIARAFQLEIDAVVKYLIMIFVSVFDPLAICLVIATSQALESRKKRRFQAAVEEIEEEKATMSTEVATVTKSEPELDEVIQMRFSDLAEETNSEIDRKAE